MSEEEILVTQGSGNVFADLGLPDADGRLLKAQILAVISDTITELDLDQKAVVEYLGIAQPDVSNLLRGRLKGFSLERLLGFARALGNDVEIKVKRHELPPRRATYHRRREGHLRLLVA